MKSIHTFLPKNLALLAPFVPTIMDIGLIFLAEDSTPDSIKEELLNELISMTEMSVTDHMQSEQYGGKNRKENEKEYEVVFL